MTELKTLSLFSYQQQYDAICRWQLGYNRKIEHHYSIRSLSEAANGTEHCIIILGWHSNDSNRSAQLITDTKKSLGHKAHVIVIADQNDESAVVTALSLGADRFFRSDTPTGILNAMINALARRSAPNDYLQHFPPYQMNQMTREVFVGGEKIQLTPREFRLAQYLFENHERIMTRASLLRDIWGLPELQYNRRVDTKMSHVRRKIGLDGTHGWQLKFPRGKGYQLLQIG